LAPLTRFWLSATENASDNAVSDLHLDESTLTTLCDLCPSFTASQYCDPMSESIIRKVLSRVFWVFVTYILLLKIDPGWPIML
jgi:hypothetical protein